MKSIIITLMVCATALGVAASQGQALPDPAINPPGGGEGGCCIDYAQAVTIRTGTPYTVPTGKVLVLQSLGRFSTTAGYSGFSIDGNVTALVFIDNSEDTVRTLPNGMTAAAGSSVTANSTDGILFGYLIDA